MVIKTVVVGPLEENCYLIEQDGQVLVVDPGDDANRIKQAIGECSVAGILITHHHFDHIGALDELKDLYRVPVYEYQEIEKAEYEVGVFHFTVLSTPGHSEDSVTFYFPEEQMMFVGDFIFRGSIGRMDLPGGSESRMLDSIQNIKLYDKDITLYPGHGPKTTLAIELLSNYYFR